MDILIPVGFGFLLNLLIFIISKGFKQTDQRSLVICLIAFLAVLPISLVLGSWLGMGLAVISLGMLIFLIFIGLVMVVLPQEK